MKKQAFFPALSLTMLAIFSTSSFAQNNGHMDDVWLSARIKTTLSNAINWTGYPDGPFELVRKIDVDTGKDSCLMHLVWDGLDSYSYTWTTYCLNGDTKWEMTDRGSLFEVTSSEVLYTDWEDIELTLANRFLRGYPVGYALGEYDGALMLTPKLSKSGQVTNVSFKNSGVTYSYDDSTGIGGSSRSGGLSLRLTQEIPAGAITCSEGGAAPLCP